MIFNFLTRQARKLASAFSSAKYRPSSSPAQVKDAKATLARPESPPKEFEHRSSATKVSKNYIHRSEKLGSVGTSDRLNVNQSKMNRMPPSPHEPVTKTYRQKLVKEVAHLQEKDPKQLHHRKRGRGHNDSMASSLRSPNDSSASNRETAYTNRMYKQFGRPKMYSPPGLFGPDSKYADPDSLHGLNNPGPAKDDEMDCDSPFGRADEEHEVIDPNWEETSQTSDPHESSSAPHHQASVEDDVPDHDMNDGESHDMKFEEFHDIDMDQTYHRPQEQSSIPVASQFSSPAATSAANVHGRAPDDDSSQYRDPDVVDLLFGKNHDDTASSVPGLFVEPDKNPLFFFPYYTSESPEIPAMTSRLGKLSLDGAPRGMTGPIRYDVGDKRTRFDDPELPPSAKRVCCDISCAMDVDSDSDHQMTDADPVDLSTAPQQSHLAGQSNSIDGMGEDAMDLCSPEPVNVPGTASASSAQPIRRQAIRIPGGPSTVFMPSKTPGTFGTRHPPRARVVRPVFV